MAPPTLHPIRLAGPWSDGFVLERQHTLSSDFIGHGSNGNPQFDTKQSEVGELVYRLKNRSDRKGAHSYRGGGHRTGCRLTHQGRGRFWVPPPRPPIYHGWGDAPGAL